MREKLRSARGETLVEILCAILIGALSVALLFSTVMVSIRMDRSAEEADKSFITDLSKAEGRTVETTGGKVTVWNTADPDVEINKAKPSVIFYGGDNAISYVLEPKLAPGGTP